MVFSVRYYRDGSANNERLITLRYYFLRLNTRRDVMKNAGGGKQLMLFIVGINNSLCSMD